MKKGVYVGAVVAFALIFSFTSDITLLATAEFYSPLGSSRPPTIPILPPIG